MKEKLFQKLYIIIGSILLIFSWCSWIIFRNSIYLILIPILFTMGIFFLYNGVIISRENKQILGKVSLILSIITITLFLIILWSLINHTFWEFFQHSMLLFFSTIILSFLTIAIFTGLLSIKKPKPKNKFGVIGLLISLISILLIFIYVIFPIIFYFPPPYPYGWGSAVTIEILDASDEGTDDLTFNANDEVFTISHKGGEGLTMSDIIIQYNGPAETLTGWQILDENGEASGLNASIPTIFEKGNIISVTATDTNTMTGGYLFRILHEPSKSFIYSETLVVAN